MIEKVYFFAVILDCTDLDGNQRINGDNWQMGRCTYCTCDNGVSVCASVMCSGPPHPECTAEMSEDSCCPTFFCPDGRCLLEISK